jgi:hypothetical protein
MKHTFCLQYTFIVILAVFRKTKQKRGNESELFTLSAYSATYSSISKTIQSAAFTFTHSSILKMEVEGSSETLVMIYQATPIHIPEDNNLQIHYRCKPSSKEASLETSVHTDRQ